MKKFFGEFKKFITRGNVIDLAVGLIIGTAFTAIVNSLVNDVVMPLIGTITGNHFEEWKWVLKKAVIADDGETILKKEIALTYGNFFQKIIDFFIIAICLFTVVRIVNRVRENNEKLRKEIESKKLTKEDKKELKSRGIKKITKKVRLDYLAEKQEKIRLAEEEQKRLEEEKEIQKRLKNPTTEDLLKQILNELKQKQ